MPRLKKYSEVYNDDSGSYLGTGNKDRDGDQDDTVKDKENSYDNVQKNNIQLSASESESQSQQKSQSKAKSNTNLHNSQLLQQKYKYSNKDSPNPNQQKGKTKKKHDADEILRKMQQQYANNQQDFHDKDDDETNAEIPDDILVGFEGKKTKNKKDKNVIKCKNKFFNIEVSDDRLQNQIEGKRNLPEEDEMELKKLELEHKYIQALKNEKSAALMEERKHMFEQKVTKIRQRMSFKNAHQDIRYKEHIKSTLQYVRDCDEVQIMLEAPKIFKGTTAKHTDGALYLKNMSQSPMFQTQSYSEESVSVEIPQKEEKGLNKRKSIKNIDRKQFYEEFNKQVKQIKAVDLRIQANELFKKSQLDELGEQFEKNEHLFKEDANSRNSIRSLSNLQNRKSQLDTEKERKAEENELSMRASISNEKKVPQFHVEDKSINIAKSIQGIGSKKQIETVIEDLSNQESNGRKIITEVEQIQVKIGTQQAKPTQDQRNQKQNVQLNNSQEPQITTKGKKLKKANKQGDKKPKQRKKRLTKQQKFHQQIKQLFEEQAEDSQDGNGNSHDESSEEGDNESVESLIDRGEVKHVAENERQARKKFMEDQLKRDEEILEKIKERITKPRKIKCQESSQSRQRKHRRIDEARKKFEQQDGDNDGKFQDDDHDKKKEEREQGIDDFEKHLRDLENQVGFKHPQKQHSKNTPIEGGIISKNRHTIWTQIKPAVKTVIKQKRGGFVSNSKVIIGPKIHAPPKNKSKQKDIKF